MKTPPSKKISKQGWISKYANRILNCWKRFKSPFEISQNYIEEIQTQLSNFYEVPEEKSFIELSY